MEIHFKKVYTPANLIISGICIIAGIALFFVNKVLGCAIVICGLITLLYKSGYKRDGEGPLLRKKSLELRSICRPSLLDFLSGKHNEPIIEPGNEGGTILLEVWYSKNDSIAYAQLSDYRELNFQKATEIIELTPEDAKTIISKL